MSIQWLNDRARGIVSDVLADDEAEFETMLVGDAVVTRDGDHYRIESGAETPEQLERASRLLAGQCDCGDVLSGRDDQLVCRRCTRTFLRH